MWKSGGVVLTTREMNRNEPGNGKEEKRKGDKVSESGKTYMRTEHYLRWQG
jgi:hypothetical protein